MEVAGVLDEPPRIVTLVAELHHCRPARHGCGDQLGECAALDDGGVGDEAKLRVESRSRRSSVCMRMKIATTSTITNVSNGASTDFRKPSAVSRTEGSFSRTLTGIAVRLPDVREGAAGAGRAGVLVRKAIFSAAKTFTPSIFVSIV
ncbi:hypothetical protein SAQ01S_26660 [Sphingomonas aquatilis NBRC 16722]|nr:hypothetical protein SAQ01S_26660 [Sphingomonas aquatilis NBRC 16722]